MDKKPIVINIPKPDSKTKKLCGVVRITPEAELVIRDLQVETGLSACEVVSTILIQAVGLIEIKR